MGGRKKKKKNLATVRGSDKKIISPRCLCQSSLMLDLMTSESIVSEHTTCALCTVSAMAQHQCLLPEVLISDSSVFCAGNCSVATVLTKHAPLTRTQWFSYGDLLYHPTIMPQHLNVQLICLWIRLC